MTAAEKFIGTWTFVSSENFDAYMKEVGVGLVTRKIAGALKPTLTFSVDGEKWKIISESTFKTLIWEFELGKEIDETTGDGRQMKSTFTLEGDKLVQIEKAIKPEDKDSRIERYIDDQGQLIITCESGGVVAKRTYKKAN